LTPAADSIVAARVTSTVAQQSGDHERLVGSDRVLAVLIELAERADGVTLDELAVTLKSAKPTIHRALVSLRKVGLADQVARGRYVLGDEFLRLAFRYQGGRPDAARVEPLLRQLANEFGETAHYAVLDGRDVVYRAKVDPPEGAVRLTSTIGGRNPADRTAVGRVLLSSRIHSLDALTDWMAANQVPSDTPHSAETLYAELERTRARGYGLDDEENEAGVNCLALPVYLAGAAEPSGAVSISALAFRLPLAQLEARLSEMRELVRQSLGAEALGPGR
jgi:DNA-binding IclR family transcriptional regulator